MEKIDTATEGKGNPKAEAAADKAYRKASRPWFKKKRFILPLIILIVIIVSTAANAGNKSSTAMTPPSTGSGSAPC